MLTGMYSDNPSAMPLHFLPVITPRPLGGQCMRFLFLILIDLILMQNMHAQSSSLFSAVRNNDMAALQAYLNKGEDPNAFDEDSDNVLINAALFASTDCIQLLLSKKADPNLKNKLGQTPLMFCTNDTVRMKLLLQYGANINAQSNSANTPLLIASAGCDQYDNIKFLLNNGADPLLKNAGRETPLFRATQFGDTMTLHLLISKGLNVNENPWGFTGLMYATRMANWPAVSCLLNNGADPNIADMLNTSPVLWAAQLNNLEMVNLLLPKTKNINTIDSIAGMTPLMWAVYNEHDNPKIIQALLEKGADINIKAKDGSTALSWAMKKGNTKTVAVLRKAGAQ